MNTLPNPAGDDTTRFESAPDPDVTLIPIPMEAPQGSPIREDASVTVNARTSNGYYVSIYNGAATTDPDVAGRVAELLSDAGKEAIEKAILEGAPTVLEFAVAGLGVLASILTTSPLLEEQYFRGTMEDGTPVTYVVLTPKQD